MVVEERPCPHCGAKVNIEIFNFPVADLLWSGKATCPSCGLKKEIMLPLPQIAALAFNLSWNSFADRYFCNKVGEPINVHAVEVAVDATKALWSGEAEE